MFTADFVDSSLVNQGRLTLPSARVTVAEAFRTSFGALLKARFNGRAVDLTRVSGVSSGSISKMLSGERGARFDMLEKLRVAFDVPPAGLFDPDAALAQIGLSRRITDTPAGETAQSLASGAGDPVDSASPTDLEGGSALLSYPDAELLTALVAYWRDMTPEARLELVGHGRRLRSASAQVAPTVGFKRA